MQLLEIHLDTANTFNYSVQNLSWDVDVEPIKLANFRSNLTKITCEMESVRPIQRISDILIMSLWSYTLIAFIFTQVNLINSYFNFLFLTIIISIHLIEFGGKVVMISIIFDLFFFYFLILFYLLICFFLCVGFLRLRSFLDGPYLAHIKSNSPILIAY